MRGDGQRGFEVESCAVVLVCAAPGAFSDGFFFNSQTELLYKSSFLAAQQSRSINYTKTTCLLQGWPMPETLRGVTGPRYLHYVARLFQSRPAPTAQEQFEQP